MCFSATASFIAGGALIASGSVALAKYRFPSNCLPLAVIPVIFGVHQLSEGVVWLGLNGHVSFALQQLAMYFFGFIAMCFWPVYIPFSILFYEYPKMRLPLFALLSSGIVLSLYLLYSFTIYSELTINVRCCDSIAYFYRLPYLQGIVDYFYVAIVVVPFLLSANRKVQWLLGPCFLGTFLVALVLESGGDYPSIWCFLAAIISLCIYIALYRERRATTLA